MRIIHLTPSIGPASGGMGAGALALARQLLASGHDARIWCVDPPAVGASVAAEGFEGRVIADPVRGPRRWAYSPSAERRSRSAVVDIVHQHGIWTAQGRVTRAFRRRGVPTIVAPHGSLEPFARRRAAWKKRLALAAFESANLEFATCLHATAEAEARTLRDFGLRAPIAIIPNGVDDAWVRASGDAERFRQRLGLAGERVLLFLSRLHPIKGLPLLFEAIAADRARFEGWRLVVGGTDERGHRAQLEALAAARGLSKAVTFAGPLFGTAKLDAFAAADLFVLPSHSENFGIVIAEALGAGVPVLATHGAPWPELETHGCGWWVPVDATQLAAALADALSRPPEDLRRMGVRGRALITSTYLWRSVVGRALEVYRWVRGEGARPGFVILD